MQIIQKICIYVGKSKLQKVRLVQPFKITRTYLWKKSISCSQCSRLCKGNSVTLLPLYTPLCTLPRQIAVIYLIGDVGKNKQLIPLLNQTSVQ